MIKSKKRIKRKKRKNDTLELKQAVGITPTACFLIISQKGIHENDNGCLFHFQ
ncbi:hypothetical protein RCO48_07565 [Peribacillus frigoritolerans]|nr:hypothetical protein [Peribacillus frigoritolerans]